MNHNQPSILIFMTDQERADVFSELLAAAGYDLTLCGKWHVSADEEPSDRGWREREVTAAKGAHHGVMIEEWRQGAPLKQSNERSCARCGNSPPMKWTSSSIPTARWGWPPWRQAKWGL